MGKTAGFFWLTLSIMFFIGVIFWHWGSIILAFATLAAAYSHFKGIDLRTKLGIPRTLKTNEEITLCPTCGIDNLAVAISCRHCGKPLAMKTPTEVLQD